MKKQLHFILLNGPMGAGKSTTANLLKKKLERTAVIQIEDIRCLVTGSEDNTLAWKIIYRMCDEYFKNGVSVLLEQSVASKDIVNKFLRLAKRQKCKISFYHFEVPKTELLKRIKQRRKAGNVSKSLISSNHKKHEQINYAHARIMDTSKMKPPQVVKLILNGLK